MTKQSFNIQLLCAALVFTSATTHSNPLRVAFRRLNSSVSAPIVAEQVAVEQVALEQVASPIGKEPQYVSLYPTMTHQLDLTYKYICDINKKLDAMRGKNKLIGFLSLIVAAETAYIVNDKYPQEVTKSLDIFKNKALELKNNIIKSVTPATKIPEESDAKNEAPAPTTPIDSIPQENNNAI